MKCGDLISRSYNGCGCNYTCVITKSWNRNNQTYEVNYTASKEHRALRSDKVKFNDYITKEYITALVAAPDGNKELNLILTEEDIQNKNITMSEQCGIDDGKPKFKKTKSVKVDEYRKMK